MRKITICQRESDTIVVYDNNEDPIDEYSQELSNLMKMGNISILKTSESSVVLRPSKITGILVEDIGDIKNEKPPEEKPPEKNEDTITDVD